MKPLIERLLAKIDPQPDGCWVWTAALQPNGYGYVHVGERRMGYAHRVAYELLVGPVPTGLDLDHLCRNRACVNPDHLDPVTRKENLNRGHRARSSIKELELPPTGLVCTTCGWSLAACSCTAADLEAAVRLEVRGSLVDGRPARELVAG